MSEQDKRSATQPDAGLAAEEHPRPSQAEGDRKTVEEDLEEKKNASGSKKPPSK